jgi:hypothetical protein
MGLFGEETGEVTKRLIDLANAEARATGIDQNVIKSTQAKLLTFGELAESADKVGGNFDRATQAASISPPPDSVPPRGTPSNSAKL